MFLFLLSILGVCFIRLLYIRYIPRSCLNVAVIPNKYPVIGHTIMLASLKNYFKLVTMTAKHAIENEDITSVHFGLFPAYVITDPRDAETVLNKCLKKMFVYKLVRPLFGKDLIAAEVPVWKRNRRIIDLAFKQQVIDGYIDFFNVQGTRLSEVFSKMVGEEVDLTEVITRNVLDTLFQTVMGKFNGEIFIGDDYVKSLHRAFQIITMRATKMWLFVDFLFNMSSYKKEFDNALKIVGKVSEEVVKLRKTEYEKKIQSKQKIDREDPKFRSFLEILIQNNSTPNGSIFNNEELTKLTGNVFLAGFDTSTYELLFILICVGSYPSVQEKIYEEITNVLGEDNYVTKENLRRLVYLEAAIKEVLRLYPIGPLVGRQADTDVALEKHVIPSGSFFVVNIWALNRHKKFWGPDADEYKPERWLNANTLPDHPAVFASFSPGRRGCVGKSYAMMHLVITLVPIIRKFRITADHKRMKLECFIMLKPVSGRFVKLELR